MAQLEHSMGELMKQPKQVVKDEKMCEQDIRYMRSCYPNRAKDMLEMLCETCDQMEYQGSCMFDDYPDKETLHHMVDQLYEQKKQWDMKNPTKRVENLFDNPELTLSQLEEKMEKELLLVLMCDEMHRRRMRYQRRKELFSTC